MRKLVSVLAFGLMAIPAIAATETLKDVPVVDINCSSKVAANPDSHTRDCALKCQQSGYAVVTADKKVLKLDSTGNSQIIAALKSSDKKDHLRADVTGDVQDDTLKVKSIKLL
jgi:hypothetical protein